MMRTGMLHLGWTTCVGLAALLATIGEARAQAPTAAPASTSAATIPAPTAAPLPTNQPAPAAPATVSEAPVYAPPPAPGETLPATPAPTPYAGPQPTAPAPNAYPTPGAPPAAPRPGNGFDFGGQSLTPLPPPPAPLDASRIRSQPWRGRYWVGFRLLVTGPLGGEVPARPNLLTLSGGADFGVRLGNVLGLGMGLSGHAQNRVRATVEEYGVQEKRVLTARALYWDALFARVHVPVRKRLQPYVEVGGGLARVDRAVDGRLYGAQMRLGLGFDGWVTRNVTLGLAGVYRLSALNDRDAGRWIVGHAMHGVVELGFHW